MNRSVVRLILGGIAGLLALGLFVGVYLGWIIAQMPANQGPRVEIPELAVGVETGGSYSWIVRTDGGVLLVDSGVDAEATAILTELEKMGLGADDVHTILLTHGHFDHTGGLPAFPRAALIHGPGEAPLLDGEPVALGWIPDLISAFVGPPVLPPNVSEAQDGQVLDVDGVSVKVLSTPGHTLGSATYVLNSIIFAGDTLVANDGAVQTLPAATTSDVQALARSVHRFGPLDGVWMADGHGGITPDADTAIEAYLAAHPKP